MRCPLHVQVQTPEAAEEIQAFDPEKIGRGRGGATLGQPGKGALPRHSALGYGPDPLETRRRRGKVKRRCRAGVVCTLDLLQQMGHTYLKKGRGSPSRVRSP
jgi:hypothetical protein